MDEKRILVMRRKKLDQRTWRVVYYEGKGVVEAFQAEMRAVLPEIKKFEICCLP
jgi:hypothetical protein